MKALLWILGISVVLGAADGKTLYKKCATCHGVKGEKLAMGKSAAIKGWKEAQTLEALKGYKKGERNVYGMGGVMKGQVAALSDKDMKALANHISKLK